MKPTRAKVMMSFVTEGPAPRFCLYIPVDAEIRHVAGKVERTPLGSVKEFLGIFVEAKVKEDTPHVFRTFGWVPLNVPVGGEENHRSIYRGAVLGMQSAPELFLFEFPDIGPTQEMIDGVKNQEAVAAEAHKQRNSPIIVVKN